MSDQPSITLYTGQTPNGIKISITLEELNIPYTVRKVNVPNNEQKEDWYLEINPNGRVRRTDLTQHLTHPPTIAI